MTTTEGYRCTGLATKAASIAPMPALPCAVVRLARLLSVVGRTLITGGVLILAFVAYQLWGTNIAAARAQNRLEDSFAERLAEADRARPSSTTTVPTTGPTTGPSAGPTTSGTTPPSPAPATAVAPPAGEAGGRIEIPEIGVDWIFVEGVSVADLKRGPGHYPTTPFPGQAGNAAIAGHRTTYGAPFNRIDELAPGDEIVLTTVQGRFTYVMTEQLLVSPSAVEVLDDYGDDRITLSACHPKYSARQRIIVVGELQGDPLPAPPPPARPDSSNGPRSTAEPLTFDVSGEAVGKAPALLWGLACAAIWLAAYLVGRRWRRWPAYALGFPVFVVALYAFFENFSRLLPANY